jgi:hypothetical protein
VFTVIIPQVAEKWTLNIIPQVAEKWTSKTP